MTDGIIAFDMEGKIDLINPATTRLLRLLPEDDSFDKIFSKLDVDVNLEKIIYLENWTSSEERVVVGDNYMHMYFAPLKDEGDIPTGVIVVIQDITEHVKLDNMRKQFVADVSHELKTPITSIMAYSDTLLEDEYDKETKNKFLKVISDEAIRMKKLVEDLLALSKYDNNENKQAKVEFDLGELVKHCQEKVQMEIDLLENIKQTLEAGKSARTMEFSDEEKELLKEYIKKGFVINSEMLKNGPKFGKDYFDELLVLRRKEYESIS